MSQESEQKSIVSHTEQAHPTLSIDTKFLDRNSPVVQSRDNMSVTADTNFYIDDAGVVEGRPQRNTSNAESRGPILSNAEKLAHEIVQKKDEIVQKNLDPEPALRFVESVCKSREWLNGAPTGELHYVAEKQREGSLIVEPSTPVPKTRARENGHAGWEYHYAQFGNETSSNLRRGGSAPPPSDGSESSQFREHKYHPYHPLGSPFQERSPPSTPSFPARTGLTTHQPPSYLRRSIMPYPRATLSETLSETSSETTSSTPSATPSGLAQAPTPSPATLDVANRRSAAGPVRRRTTTNQEKKHLCSVCGNAYLRPSGLAVHLRTHSGEKPFLCPKTSCARSAPANAFSVKSNWARHIRALHPELVASTLVRQLSII